MKADLSKTVSDRLFDTMGPLYELAPKADLAFAFNLIDSQMLTALRGLFKIRNAFAHTTETLHFETYEINDLCKKLPGWIQGIHSRALFGVTSMNCIKKLDEKINQAKTTKDERAT